MCGVCAHPGTDLHDGLPVRNAVLADNRHARAQRAQSPRVEARACFCELAPFLGRDADEAGVEDRARVVGVSRSSVAAGQLDPCLSALRGDADDRAAVRAGARPIALGLVSGGEPDGSTEILVSEAYRCAFTRGSQYGYAAAYAVLIFVILVLFTKMGQKRLATAGGG